MLKAQLNITRNYLWLPVFELSKNIYHKFDATLLIKLQVVD